MAAPNVYLFFPKPKRPRAVYILPPRPNPDNLFGVVNHSPFTVIDLLRVWMSREKISYEILTNDREPHPAELYFAFDFGIARLHMGWLHRRRAALIIFDTPIVLSEIPNLQYLDAEEPAISYVLTFKRLDLEPIKRAVLRDPPRRLDLDLRQIKIIPRLLNKIKEGRLLDKLTDLINNTPGTATKRRARHAILTYIFDLKANYTDLAVEMSAMYSDSETAMNYVKVLLDFIRSSDGQHLRRAAVEAARKFLAKDPKPINYSAISRRWKIDRFELRYLVRQYRASIVEAGFRSRPLSEYTAQPKRTDQLQEK